MYSKKDKARDYKLRSRYGITLAEYNKMFKKQGYKCAICRKKWNKRQKRFAVDHNHHTKYIRGILCTYCNSKLLKYLRDDKNKALGVIKYLTKALKDDIEWD